MIIWARTSPFSSSGGVFIKDNPGETQLPTDIRKSGADLRPILNLDGTDLVEASFHDVLALQHELAALALEVFLLPDRDLELAHLLHLLSVHGCSLSF